MNTFGLIGALALATLGGATAAQAQRAPGNIEAGVTAGTEGVGPELSYRFDDLFGVRANATFLGLGHSVTSDGINYNGHVDLASGGAMVDIYPFRGGFFLSAGARVNGNRGRLKATPTQNTQIGTMTFTPAQIGTITGRAETKDFAPQLTIGYGGSLRPGFVVGIEAGALFQGAARIRDFRSNGSLANDPNYLAQLEQERRDVQDDVNDYKVYPVVQLKLGYRF